MPRDDHDESPHLPLLPDRLGRSGSPLKALFVGINPGLRSARLGHHFAGFSNRFWKLVSESGLTPRAVTFEDDQRMPAWGYGMTNLVPRPTPGISDLTPVEYRAGRAALERKIRRARPEVVVLIGVSLARALLPGLRASAATQAAGESPIGLQQDTLAGAPVFVLPNPSGRNAHYSYARMLDAFRALKAHLDAHATRATRG